jgi:RIO kinase 1
MADATRALLTLMEMARMDCKRDIPDDLKAFFEEGWIDEILFPIKSGKEAVVYCCKAATGRSATHLALKVYTPRDHRNFANDAIYREGRVIADQRLARAVAKKSVVGRAQQFGDWVASEFAILQRLADAGVPVARPLAAAGNAILMEFVGVDAIAAPQLVTRRLSPRQAEDLLEQALRAIETMIARHVVHGDLSAYNMLDDRGELRIIDLPQAVDPRRNRNARQLLARDVANVCRYFADQGADAEPGTFADDLWRLYRRANP